MSSDAQADELISHTYHNIYGMSLTGLRFFTVYGPWGRPDMAAFKFAKNIMMGANITVFQVGHMPSCKLKPWRADIPARPVHVRARRVITCQAVACRSLDSHTVIVCKQLCPSNRCVAL